MTVASPCPTFRDPDGSLALEGDLAIRTISDASRLEVLRFLESPFYQRLQERGDVVSTIIDDSERTLRLLHPRIPIATYPWEWTPGQWLAAAELTLSLCREALAEGWILKDATPLNVLFIGPRPVLVDVLSFDRRDPASSVWLAYGQYVRTFLLPLVMNQLGRWPLALSLFRRDGYEPVELFAALSWRQRLTRAAFWPITLPAWLEGSKKKGGNAAKQASATRMVDPGAALHILERMIDGLGKRTRRAVPTAALSGWSDYAETLTHYTAEETSQKRTWIREAVEEMSPRSALDIGANSGEYSGLMAAMGVEVVALERDAASAERIFRMSQAKELPILTVHADLARPTPAVGWQNSESSALLPRLEGQFDVVLMLAVIHHLLLLEQIPLTAILSLCYQMTRRSLIIEWVPVTDPMFQDLMRGRESLYGSLAEDDLIGACEGFFEVVRRQALGNGRILILLEKSIEKG
jgi:hypothetical protein